MPPILACEYGLMNALEAIDNFLRSLQHTGADGFEGLVASLCAAETGQAFRLSGSGQQHGQDARSETHSGNNIKVEAKHYFKSSISLRELTAELVQASRHAPGIELWVIAASCALKDQDVLELELLAHEQNIEILILDNTSAHLPRLPVLMAAHSATVADWARAGGLAFSADLATALKEVTQLSSFSSVLHQVGAKLSGTLLGYEDARVRVRKNLIAALTDDSLMFSRFGQRAAVRAPDRHVVRRIRMHDRISEWWTAWHTHSSNAVILGEEGSGKTWALLDWIAERLDADTLPIVLPFFAGAESITSRESIESITPRLLLKWTRTGTEEFWKRRVVKWSAAGVARPLVLIVADALNENVNVPWPLFFRSLGDTDFRGVAVLATDRPGHWQPFCSLAGLQGFMELPVQDYSDAELQKALSGRDVPIASIPLELQELIRKPRYCNLVATHFEEMLNDGDFTRERLIFLEMRERAERKFGRISADEFVDIIRNLAKRYRESRVFARAEIATLLPTGGADRQIYQEILDGGFVQPGPAGTVALDRTKLVYGLGMLLADQLRLSGQQGLSEARLTEEIAGWLEPQPEMQLKVEVCGSAVFHAVLDPEYPRSCRLGLIRYWMILHNWVDGFQASFAGFVTRIPEDFLTLAEEFWSSDRDSGPAQQIIATALQGHRDHPKVEAALIARINRWMGFVHLDGHPMYRRDSERSNRIVTEIALRVGGTPLPDQVELFGCRLTLIRDDLMLRLIRLGLLVISSGPVMPFVDAIVVWAVAAAVMDSNVDSSVVSWVVRLSEPGVSEALLGRAQELFNAKDALATQAAHTLLWRIGSIDAQRLRSAHPLPEGDQESRLRAIHEADPCRSGHRWTDELCTLCMDRSDIHIYAIIDRLEHRLYDPDFVISQAFLRRVLSALPNPASIRASLSQTDADYAFQQTAVVLASKDPAVFAENIRNTVRSSQLRDDVSVYPIAVWLPEVSPILGLQEVEALRLRIDSLGDAVASKQAGEKHRSTLETAEAYCVLGIAPYLAPFERLSSLIRRSSRCLDLMQLQVWFEPLADADLSSAIELIHTAKDDVTLARLLWFTAQSRPELSPKDRQRIASLCVSTHAPVRGAALRFVRMIGDGEMRTTIIRTCCLEDEPGSYASEEWTRLIIESAPDLSLHEVLRLLHSADVGYALARRGLQTHEVLAYAELLNARWSVITSALDPSISFLPPVSVAAHAGDPGSVIPEFVAAPIQPPSSKHPNASWSTKTLDVNLADSLDADRHVEKVNEMNERGYYAVLAARNTEAFQWYGVAFNRASLERLLDVHRELVMRWIAPVLEQGPSAERVTLRLGSLLHGLCPLLLSREPSIGFQLWDALRKRRSSPMKFDALKCVFEAGTSAATERARSLLLEECSTDAALAQLALNAEITDNHAWLEQTIRRLVGGSTAQRARGLTLASFSNTTLMAFDGILSDADVGGTWLAPQIPGLRVHVQKNEFAQRWYERFLNSSDIDVAFGAWFVLTKCGDHRFFTWSGGFERDDMRHHRRLRFVHSRRVDLERMLDRTKERESTLFGIRIEKGEIAPFM